MEHLILCLKKNKYAVGQLIDFKPIGHTLNKRRCVPDLPAQTMKTQVTVY